jgi:hypothetical protein
MADTGSAAGLEPARKSPGAILSSGRILALAGRFTEQGERLEGAQKEVRYLARRFAGVTTRLLGPAGDLEHSGSDSVKSPPAGGISRDSVLSASAFSGFDILHFAAHSTADNQSPWRSAIHLGRTVEPVLRASEIAGWKLPADLVVLSSCQSAGGRILSGEGVQGLTSAFLSAGVPAVVATLWPVDDLVTVELMTAFYEELHRGQSVSASIHEARCVLRRNPHTNHPFFWAGFVLIGEGNLRVDLVARLRTWPLWGLAVLILLIIWGSFGIVRKKLQKSR